MAEMYREIGDLARSPELMREVLEIGRRTIPLHPLMIDGLNMYADQMAKRGQIEETSAITWRLWSRASGAAASTHPTTGESSPWRGSCGWRRNGAGPRRRVSNEDSFEWEGQTKTVSHQSGR